jgi:hypothetical protein
MGLPWWWFRFVEALRLWYLSYLSAAAGRGPALHSATALHLCHLHIIHRIARMQVLHTKFDFKLNSYQTE